MNTMWRFYKLTNLPLFAALLEDVAMGCKDGVLPKLLLRNLTIKCLRLEESTKQPYNNNLCFFRAPALHLHGNKRLDEKTSKKLSLFINREDGICANQFQGDHLNDIPIVGGLRTLKIQLYDIDFADGKYIGAPARRSVPKHGNTLRLLRYNNHICYLSDIKAVFEFFRCPNCNIFFNRTSNLERHLTCSERVRHVYPKNVSPKIGTIF